MPDRERPRDPFQRFREIVDSAERELNELFAERSARDDANKRRARFSDFSLDAQKRISELWGRTFHGMNLPTREDVVGLGKRIAEVESALARIETALRDLARSREPASRSEPPVARVPRTRVPPAGAKPPSGRAAEGGT